jgi:hypothetical protein
MTKINDGFAIVHKSPVWRAHDLFPPEEFLGVGPDDEQLSWYVEDFAIEYDYERARDLMRRMGYAALDPPMQGGCEPPGPWCYSTEEKEDKVISLEVNPQIIPGPTFGITSTILMTIVTIRRREP